MCIKFTVNNIGVFVIKLCSKGIHVTILCVLTLLHCSSLHAWALTRGNTAGHVEPQETQKTTCAFKNDPNTCYISGDKDISMVCMCILCVGVHCNTPQRLQTDLPCYMYYIVR